MVIDFETHIMPRLAREYVKAGKAKVPFDLEEVRNLGADKNGEGIAMEAWEQIDLQDNVTALVTKGLIEELGGGGKYQISDLGVKQYVK